MYISNNLRQNSYSILLVSYMLSIKGSFFNRQKKRSRFYQSGRDAETESSHNSLLQKEKKKEEERNRDFVLSMKLKLVLVIIHTSSLLRCCRSNCSSSSLRRSISSRSLTACSLEISFCCRARFKKPMHRTPEMK